MFPQIWDVRSWKQICSLAENADFISDMAVDSEGSTLLATSGDGSLTAVDLRQRKLLQRSDTNESELLSLAIIKVDHIKRLSKPAPLPDSLAIAWEPAGAI